MLIICLCTKFHIVAKKEPFVRYHFQAFLTDFGDCIRYI